MRGPTVTLRTFVNSSLELNVDQAQAILYVLDSEVPTCHVEYEWGWMDKRRPHPWEPELAEVHRFRGDEPREAALLFHEQVALLRRFVATHRSEKRLPFK